MRELAGRTYFRLCRGLGRLLRAGRYSRALVVNEGDARVVRKQRLAHAPVLVWLGRWLVRLLDTGVCVLPQRDWEERERLVYQRFYGTSIRIDATKALILPCFAGETLANLLDDPDAEAPVRNAAIERAVTALAELHAAGLTHGDAMAENVMVDLDGGVARWFDFETIHDSRRPVTWRRADDVRALLATCVLRTPPQQRPETFRLILDVYGDHGVSGVLAASFMSVWQRPLTFHLGQAGLSYEDFREIARLLEQRRGE